MKDRLKDLAIKVGIPVLSGGTAVYEAAIARINALENAARECNGILNTLSMGVDGHLRYRICKANNYLNAALGKGLHHIAGNWEEDEDGP